MIKDLAQLKEIIKTGQVINRVLLGDKEQVTVLYDPSGVGHMCCVAYSYYHHTGYIVPCDGWEEIPVRAFKKVVTRWVATESTKILGETEVPA